MQRTAAKPFSHRLRLLLISLSVIALQVFSPSISSYSFELESKLSLLSTHKVSIANKLFAFIKHNLPTPESMICAFAPLSAAKPRSYRITSTTSTYTSQELFWPLHGKITSGYGMRRHPFTRKIAFHAGIDIRAKYGTPIVCPADGIVVSACRSGAMGREVRIKTGDKLLVFGHLSVFKCKPGDNIRAGQVLGSVGISGRATGPHLHFAIKRNDRWVNPMIYLEPHCLAGRL